MSAAFDIAPDWRGRGIATFKVVLFIAIFVALNMGANEILLSSRWLMAHFTSTEGHLLLSMGALMVVTIGLTAVMARVNGERFAAFGFGDDARATNFALGVLCGLIGLALHLGVLLLLGDASWKVSPLDAALLWEAGMLAVLLFVVAFTEEFLFRGYVLVELARAVSFWPAAIGLALMFGAVHWLKGGGENFVSGCQAAGAALVYALSFRMTGSLWIAIGSHFGWNFAQSFIFGVPDSALMFAHPLLQSSMHGPDFLTGGTVGPEGSFLSAFEFPLVLAASWIRRSREVQPSP
ncbi:MAG TPA: CPBP family intramembrane glutamic endopeptidase [Rhizomicrobium sp.]|nr:CPBP family intramembrane glutamic endopeptidase [Rhizomicrobium sp.]